MTSTTTSHSVNDLEPIERKTVNYFFANLSVVFGHKFKVAMPSDEEIRVQKLFYAPLLKSLDPKVIDDGFRQIALLRTQNKHVWLDIAELLPYFIKGLKTESEMQDDYQQYLNGGLDIYKQMRLRDSDKVVRVSVGKKWSSSAIFEASKRLGKAEFLVGNERAKEDKFLKVYRDVLQEEINGKEFPEPVEALEYQECPEDKKRRLEQSRKSENFKKFKQMFSEGVGKLNQGD